MAGVTLEFSLAYLLGWITVNQAIFSLPVLVYIDVNINCLSSSDFL